MASVARDPSFKLTVEAPVALPRAHELQLLRAAVAQRPDSLPLRSRLAELLFLFDAFDELLALLEPLPGAAATFDTVSLVAEAHISRETAADDVLAEAAARRALTLAGSSHQHGSALAILGKALGRQGKADEARDALCQALEIDPHNVNAYKRLATMDLDSGDTRAVLRIADRLIERGIGHARLLVARALAFGSSGRIAEARDAIGLDRFLQQRVLAPPSGSASLAIFNAAVKKELHRHPDIRFNRYGTASAETWRIDQPAVAGAHHVRQLQDLIQRAVTDYVETLVASDDNPWVRARPAAAQLHNWCVMTDAAGYETWHVHQNGWLSGVYYVDVPPIVATGSGREGCIAFGLPADLVGTDNADAYGEHLVRPVPGLLILFPSHTYHRTYPHGSDHRRICLAFDIQPL